MNKKIFMVALSILLTLSIICLFSCKNNNEQDTPQDSTPVLLPFEIDNSGCISRFYANETNSIDIVIPSSYSINDKGEIISGTAYEIKKIGENCFSNNTLIQSVSIPNTVVSIEESAFYNCSNLSKINVTSCIVSIGKNAFEACPKLTSITRNGKTGLILEENNNLSSFNIPETITKIDNNAFSNWTKLNSIIIDNAYHIGNNAFANCNNLSKVEVNAIVSFLGEDVFLNCEKLQTLQTTPSYDGIYFASNQNIEKFTVPQSITLIQNSFFYGWKNLKELTIHKELTSLGMIFKDNENLTKLTCGSNNVLSLFYRRPTSETVIESKKMYVAVHKPYSGSYTYNYYIPNTLKEITILNDIESYCFYNMKSVQKIYLPSGLSDFGTGAFAGCTGLTNVYFTTDRDWCYSMDYYTSDYGTISKDDMNNSVQLAKQLKAHNGSYYRWYKK